MENFEIQQLKDEIGRLRSEIADLKAGAYKNNFSSTQIFNKACIFNDRLKVPVFDSAPAVGEIGDLIVISVSETTGLLYVCTESGDVADPAVFTLVGSQT